MKKITTIILFSAYLLNAFSGTTNINVGAYAGDPSCDTVRNAFIKVNGNFSWVNTVLGTVTNNESLMLGYFTNYSSTLSNYNAQIQTALLSVTNVLGSNSNGISGRTAYVNTNYTTITNVVPANFSAVSNGTIYYSTNSAGTTYTNGPGVVGVISGNSIGTNTTGLLATNDARIMMALTNAAAFDAAGMAATAAANATNFALSVGAAATNLSTVVSNGVMAQIPSLTGYATFLQVTSTVTSYGYTTTSAVASLIGGSNLISGTDGRVVNALTNAAAFQPTNANLTTLSTGGALTNAVNTFGGATFGGTIQTLGTNGTISIMQAQDAHGTWFDTLRNVSPSIGNPAITAVTPWQFSSIASFNGLASSAPILVTGTAGTVSILQANDSTSGSYDILENVNPSIGHPNPTAVAPWTFTSAATFSAGLSSGGSVISGNGSGLTNLYAGAVITNVVYGTGVTGSVANGTLYITNTSSGGGSAWAFYTNISVPPTSTITNIPHGLGVTPTRYVVRLVMTNGIKGVSTGYKLNQEVPDSCLNGGNFSYEYFCDATNAIISTRSSGIYLFPPGGGAETPITNADWNIRIYASP